MAGLLRRLESKRNCAVRHGQRPLKISTGGEKFLVRQTYVGSYAKIAADLQSDRPTLEDMHRWRDSYSPTGLCLKLCIGGERLSDRPTLKLCVGGERFIVRPRTYGNVGP